MANISTTKMSSKGQVVIPEAIRKKLGLKSGDQFVVTGDKDVVILKSISPPSLDEFDDLIADAFHERNQLIATYRSRHDLETIMARFPVKRRR